jgi:hypothetical protein
MQRSQNKELLGFRKRRRELLLLRMGRGQVD